MTDKAEHSTRTRTSSIFALETHLSNPRVVSHIAAMNDGVLSGATKQVIYSDWAEPQKQFLKDKLSGANLPFSSMITGL